MKKLVVVAALGGLMLAASGCAMQGDEYENRDKNLIGSFCPVYFAPNDYCSHNDNLVHAYAPGCQDVCVPKQALQSCGCVPSHRRWCTPRGPGPVYCILLHADAAEPVGPNGEQLEVQAIRYRCEQRGICPAYRWRYPIIPLEQ